MDSLIVRARARDGIGVGAQTVRAEVLRGKPAALRTLAVTAGGDFEVAPRVIEAPVDAAPEPQPTAASGSHTSYEASRTRGIAAYVLQLKAADERTLERGVVIRRQA